MARKKSLKITLPAIVEKDEDGFYVIECPFLKGCYTQGETLDEALKNIREVIEMCLEEDSEDEISDYATRDITINPAIGGASPGSGVATPAQ